jgi:exodeoxyribonuclease-3
MLKVITVNLNGLRSAARKGFFTWLEKQNADVICVQELKAQADDLKHPQFYPEGYYAYFHFAEKKGYSGVGIYSRFLPKEIVTGLGFETADQEGRYIAVNVGDIWIASLYMPSGTSGEERQTIKYGFLDHYAAHLKKLSAANSNYIICGDWNIAHKPIDLKNWRGNQKNSGFLPAERAWLDQLFDELDFEDTFRSINQEPDHYTWWSNRGRAWEKNVGWRIDYQVTTPSLKGKVKSAMIYKEERFSDHAPLIIEYDITVMA